MIRFYLFIMKGYNYKFLPRLLVLQFENEHTASAARTVKIATEATSLQHFV